MTVARHQLAQPLLQYHRAAPLGFPTEAHMQFYDAGLDVADHTLGADYLANVLFNLMLQITKRSSIRGNEGYSGRQWSRDAAATTRTFRARQTTGYDTHSDEHRTTEVRTTS